MTAPIPFFDGHNDFLLRLMMTPAPREETWLGQAGAGHLDLARMKAAGFAGGLFAIFVPPQSSGPPPDFKALMADPPYALLMPPRDGPRGGPTHGPDHGGAVTLDGAVGSI